MNTTIPTIVLCPGTPDIADQDGGATWNDRAIGTDQDCGIDYYFLHPWWVEGCYQNMYSPVEYIGSYLNPMAAEFVPKKALNPNAAPFKPAVKKALNPHAQVFVPATIVVAAVTAAAKADIAPATHTGTENAPVTWQINFLCPSELDEEVTDEAQGPTTVLTSNDDTETSEDDNDEEVTTPVLDPPTTATILCPQPRRYVGYGILGLFASLDNLSSSPELTTSHEVKDTSDFVDPVIAMISDAPIQDAYDPTTDPAIAQVSLSPLPQSQGSFPSTPNQPTRLLSYFERMLEDANAPPTPSSLTEIEPGISIIAPPANIARPRPAPAPLGVGGLLPMPNIPTAHEAAAPAPPAPAPVTHTPFVAPGMEGWAPPPGLHWADWDD